MSKPTSTTTYACKYCNVQFPTRSSRDVHQRKCIKDDILLISQQSFQLVRNSEQRYACLSPQCTLSYTAKTSLKRHLQSHPDHIPQVSQSCMFYA